ncbi:MAG: menaquinol-cytochrome C reductase [Chloroflexia bacterium]
MATETRPTTGVTIKERNVTEQKGAPVLTSSARSRLVSPAAVEADTVQVWPHLVVIEFLGAVVFTIMLVLLGTLANAPLEPLANGDKTPNPSKAPWYFMNLQELLLHMNPALAGVIVPTIALLAIAAIPYIDKGTHGLGVWFYNKRSPKIMLFTAIYTTVVLTGLITFDSQIHPKNTFQTMLAQGGPLGGIPDMMGMMGDRPTASGFLVESIVNWILPTIFMVGFIVLLIVLLKIMFRGLSTTELTIGLFTGFFTTYVVLTFVGQFLRGHGMELYPPWAVPPTDFGLVILHRLGLA